MLFLIRTCIMDVIFNSRASITYSVKPTQELMHQHEKYWQLNNWIFLNLNKHLLLSQRDPRLDSDFENSFLAFFCAKSLIKRPFCMNNRAV